jgi:hypothetical protein
MPKQSFIISIPVAIALTLPLERAFADAVVSDGRFTNVYVYPNPSQESWDDHLKRLARDHFPLLPSDWTKNFTSEHIDAFTDALMSHDWPSYFGALHQYGGINPPQFFGSYTASQKCVDAALKDRTNGVLGLSTIRSLSNCHDDGMDPSPQVNLIFSPDIPVDFSWPDSSPDVCQKQGDHDVAYHSGGLNTPNFAILPTEKGCVDNFDDFTKHFSHEDIEILSDPALVGHGGAGGTELGDACEKLTTHWGIYNVQRYRSDNDNMCWPNFPDGTTTLTWVLAEGSPVVRFTGDVHDFTLHRPSNALVTDAKPTSVQLWIQTGGDDLRGGNGWQDNANAGLTFADGGTMFTFDINGGIEWGNGQTHFAQLLFPSRTADAVKDINGVTLSTNFGGGLSGDNWNVDKVALLISIPAGATTYGPPSPIVCKLLDVSGGPLIRFTGDRHDLSVDIPRQSQSSAPSDPCPDNDQPISSLELLVATGNDDLRGGGNPGDNADVSLHLANGSSISLSNINHSGTWAGWTENLVWIPVLPGTLRAGDIKSLSLHTGFGGGIGGDNWNVQRLQLRATYPPPPGPPPVLSVERPPGLISSTIAPSQSEVEQGGTVNVVGDDFNTSFSGKVNIGWIENNSKIITTTELRGAPPGNPASLWRLANPDGNRATLTNSQVTLTNIIPNTSYAFSVQDCNTFDFSCTGWSNVVNYNSGPATPAAVDLILQQAGRRFPVGSANVGPNRSFSTTIKIGPSVPPGNYSLVAERSGAIEASAPLSIVAAGGQFTPEIKFIDRNLGTSSSSERVTVGNNITVRGEGFASGPVKLSLDTLRGTVLATPVASGSPPTFQVTFLYNAAAGDHKIVASQSHNGEVLQATGTIQAEIIQ